MSVTEQTAGIAVLCNPQGVITDIIRDGLNLPDRLIVGQSFTSVVDSDCADKASRFLETIRAQHAAFNWELTVPVQDWLIPLHFAGGATDEGFLIVGAKSRSGVAQLYQELTGINDERTNALLATMKDLSVRAQEQAERDSTYYDELSRLNNELATTQRELAKKNSELSRLNEQKNQFLGIAAHDLRNPLNIIAGYSEFLLDTAAQALSHEQLGFVRAIRSSSEFMLSLVNDLLDVSMIEAGKLKLDFSEADLLAIIAHNVSLNSAMAQRKEIRIVLHQEQSIPRMMLDVPKIEQVLNNLIDNAVKFSPPGSTIEVDVEQSEQEVLISVRDAGPGVAANELDRLFRPFEKTSVKSTGGEKSTGLGLVIVKKIVAGHGGRIWVESEAGKGARFCVSLPVRSAAFDGV